MCLKYTTTCRLATWMKTYMVVFGCPKSICAHVFEEEALCKSVEKNAVSNKIYIGYYKKYKLKYILFISLPDYPVTVATDA